MVNDGHNFLNAGAKSGKFHNNCMFNQHGNNGKTIPSTWIVLTNQSTIDVLSKTDLRSNIQQVDDRTMVNHCNAGTAKSKLVVGLGNYKEVWYQSYEIAKILSSARLKNN